MKRSFDEPQTNGSRIRQEMKRTRGPERQEIKLMEPQNLAHLLRFPNLGCGEPMLCPFASIYPARAESWELKAGSRCELFISSQCSTPQRRTWFEDLGTDNDGNVPGHQDLKRDEHPCLQ